jgi:hypothetical protein
MATDIVGSLFGVTPEMFQQRQAALADKQAIEFAQLTPMQQAQAGIYRGAYGLAGALGGALGAQDPQLQMISTRNSIARQIDYNNPESIMQGVRSLSQAGDTVGAMQLADVARKMESEMAQTFQRTAAGRASLAQAARERATAVPTDIAKATRIGELVNALQTPDLDEMTRANLQAQLDALRPTKTATESAQLQLATAIEGAQEAVDMLQGQPASPERDAALRRAVTRLTALERQLPQQPKEDKLPSVGGDREAVALEVYNAPFASLTPEQRAAVNKRVEAQQAAKTPKVEVRNVMPGDTKLADIPAFRASVQKTIDPQLKAITASQQALQAINDSLATGNFASYRAAQVQFAKAIAGAGDLSQKELKAAGADPSLLGGAADYLSTIFSSTPTADTQRKIRSTLQAIQTVARKQALGEVDQQRKIALRSPGYKVEAVNEALMFPQLQSDVVPTPAVTGGDLAAAAAAELARRRGGK